MVTLRRRTASWRLAAMLGGSLAIAVIGAACGSAAESTTDPDMLESVTAGAYVFVDQDRSAAADYWEPLLHCADDPPCDPAGSLPGAVLALRARHLDEGWGIKVVFDPEMTSAERRVLMERLSMRAEGLGKSVVFLQADDLWPSCEGEPDCLTVAETLIDM